MKGRTMFDPTNREDPNLVRAISAAFADLESHSADSPEYEKAVDQLVKLQAMKKKRLDPNTLAAVGANLAIGFAVIKYERVGVITTKVWSFFSKI